MKEAVEMRRYDDQAKILNKKTPSWSILEITRKFTSIFYQINNVCCI